MKETMHTNHEPKPSIPGRAPAADWRLFAAAAGAGLAAVSQADASIIYVNPTAKPTVTLPGAAPFGNGSVHATFMVDNVRTQLCFTANDSAYVGKAGGGGGALFWAQTGSVCASRFSKGAAVHGGTSNFGVLRGPSRGYFTPNKVVGYAGFKLPASKGGGLGWMRFEVLDRDGNGYPDGVEAIDWAYNDAGGGINAGQGLPAAVPEPGASTALALLALGSAGVLAWRKRRAQVVGVDRADAV